MATRTPYRKLSLGPSERVTARNSHVGYFVIADYIDPADSQRYLVFERSGGTVTVKRQAKKLNAKQRPTEGATAFPPAEAARG